MNKKLLITECTLFGLLIIRLLNNDFYYDEYYTLHHGVFRPLSDIMFNYRSMNLHPMLTVYTHIVTSIENVTLYHVLDYPQFIRIPMLIFPALTIVYLWNICLLKHNQYIGLIAVTVLITTIPYYYYAVQIRGYSMSIAFMTMLLYYTFNPKANKIWITVLSGLLFYSMFSNGCFLVILGGYLVITKNNKWKYIALGTVISIVVALPLINGMIHDSMYNNNLFAKATNTLTHTTCETLVGFVSYRWLLLPIAIIGLYDYCVIRKNIVYSCLLLLPFLLFAIQGGKIYGRFMLPVLPCFCIMIAIGLYRFKKVVVR